MAETAYNDQPYIWMVLEFFRAERCKLNDFELLADSLRDSAEEVTEAPPWMDEDGTENIIN